MSLDLKEPFEIDIENVVNDIAAFIRKNVEGAGCKTAIVGLSGGVDSAVSAALSVKALGCENVVTPCLCRMPPATRKAVSTHMRCLTGSKPGVLTWT